MYIHQVYSGNEIPGSLSYEIYGGSPDGYQRHAIQVRKMNSKDWHTLGLSTYATYGTCALWITLDTLGEMVECKVYMDASSAIYDFNMSWPGHIDESTNGSDGSVRIEPDQLSTIQNEIISSGNRNRDDFEGKFNQLANQIADLESRSNPTPPETFLGSVPNERHGRKVKEHSFTDGVDRTHTLIEWDCDSQALQTFSRPTIVTWSVRNPGEHEDTRQRVYTTWEAALQDTRSWTQPKDRNGMADIRINTGTNTKGGGSVTITSGNPTPHKTPDKKDKNMKDKLGYDPHASTKDVLIDTFARGGKVAVACQFNTELVGVLSKKLMAAGIPKDIVESPLVTALISLALPSMLHAGAHHFDGFPKRDFFMTSSALALEGTSRESLQPLLAVATEFVMEAFTVAQKTGVAEVLDIKDAVKAKAAEAEAAEPSPEAQVS